MAKSDFTTTALPQAAEKFAQAKTDPVFREQYLDAAYDLGTVTSQQKLAKIFNDSTDHMTFLRMAGVL